MRIVLFSYAGGAVEVGIGVEGGGWCTLDAVASPGADQPHFEQIELGPTVHLPLRQLEASDLLLGLAIRPWLDQRRSDSRSVPRQALGEGREEATGSRIDSGVEVRRFALTDDVLEPGQE